VGKVMLPLDLLEKGWEAQGNGNLEQFLRTLDQDTAIELRKSVTPQIAYANEETMMIGDDVPNEYPELPGLNTTWDAHKAWLQNHTDLPETAIINLASSTAEIADLLARPGLDKIYGLVVGYVQSGKTAHFTGLMARAADLGYTFVIVLSGILNDLRTQGQRRLIKDIIGDHHNEMMDENTIPVEGRKAWELLTTIDGDFKKDARDVMAKRMANSLEGDRILVAVVKKNVTVLEHLMNGVKSAGPELCSKHKVLIIDDEADHATVNTGGDGSEHEDPDLISEDDDDDDIFSESERKETDPSRTNLMVRRIIKSFDKLTYVGYTATPFANILIDPKEGADDPIHGLSLYPRHFIKSLKRPDGYFGPDTFFGDLDDPDVDTPYTTSLTESQYEEILQIEYNEDIRIEETIPLMLQNAIMDFILTGIVRHIRRNAGIKMNKHHTMLIHISRLNSEQEEVHYLISELIDQWKTKASSTLGTSSRKFRQQLQDRWELEFMTQSSISETWSQIEDELLKDEDEDGWIHNVCVRMINSLNPDESLDYDKSPEGLNVIAIGGNKLSRGLTLEGLCVSFFLRHTKMYDTLMQMGRWFGYRHGYGDLVRVHTSETLLAWFAWLVKVEKEVRSDIHRYQLQGKSPLELAVRIPLHSKMKPTSSGKMKSAITTISDYNGRSVQSIRLPIDQPERLQTNLDATTLFINSMQDENLSSNKRMTYWDEVDATLVANYIEKLDLVGPPLAVFDKGGIANYIRKEWSGKKFIVAHPGNPYQQLKQAPDELPPEDPEWNIPRRYIARTQLCDSAGQPRIPADIRAVSEPQDMLRIEHLQSNQDKVALLIYLIAPGSFPRGGDGKGKRIALANHGIPIVGLALKFPGEKLNKFGTTVVSVKGIRSE
jgi:hypothetical protein